MKVCAQCQSPFEVSAEDKAFYQKASPVIGGKTHAIPDPALCPDCRRQRRFAWRNERSLYHRKCDLSGKQMISIYSPDKPYTVYAHDEWWSDKWNAKDFGQDFDFSRPFFDQWNELSHHVPHLAIYVWNSENASYCNYVGNVKDSYLIFGSVYSENCLYGSPYYSKDCVDTLVVRDCEHCYECVDSRKLYECFYCQDCHGSSGLIYCYDLENCRDCIGCAGLRNKQYYIFNQPHTKEEYEAKKVELNLCVPEAHGLIRKELEKLKLKVPHKFMQSKNAENASGNYIYECKNVHDSYYADRSEDASYCAQVVDLKDCFDNNYTEENELCCDYLGAYQNVRTSFSKFCNRVSEALYCDSCFTSKNLFGCIGLRNAEYCILNKQYSKEEYEALVPKIIAHMKKTGEWGEFPPANLSPFAYNESVAQEYFPLTKVQTDGAGLQWHDEESGKAYKGPEVEVARDIKDVSDDITKQILTCELSGKLFKVIPQELEFYRKFSLPIPRVCPDERHKARLALRNPRKLYSRACAGCKAPIQTTYAPERPEKVLCEACYRKEVY